MGWIVNPFFAYSIAGLSLSSEFYNIYDCCVFAFRALTVSLRSLFITRRSWIFLSERCSFLLSLSRYESFSGTMVTFSIGILLSISMLSSWVSSDLGLILVSKLKNRYFCCHYSASDIWSNFGYRTLLILKSYFVILGGEIMLNWICF